MSKFKTKLLGNLAVAAMLVGGNFGKTIVEVSADPTLETT